MLGKGQPCCWSSYPCQFTNQEGSWVWLPAHSVFQVCLHIGPKTFKPGVNVWVRGECTAIDGQPLWTPALPADSLSGSWGTEEGLTKQFSFTFFTLRSHRAAEELVTWATHLYMSNFPMGHLSGCTLRLSCSDVNIYKLSSHCIHVWLLWLCHWQVCP